MQSSSVLLSVIVCTRNRADELAGCLPELSRQARELPDVEVVVVDNGSTDNTRQVVEEMAAEHRIALRHVYEGKPGLCRARNRGRAEARGSVLAYIDDDEVVGPGWVRGVRDHFRTGKSDCLAGKIAVKVHGELPLGFTQDLLWIFGETHFGEEARALKFPQHPQGGNFAITTEVFDRVGGFDTNIKLYGDETDFFFRASKFKFSTWYDPALVVTQHIPAHRLTQEVLKTKAYIWGRGSSMVWLLSSPGALRRLGRAAEHMARAAYVGGRWCLSPQFGRYFTFWHECGKLRQLISGIR